MKIRICLISLLILAISLLGGTRKALFLGNSYTYVNDLPSMVAQIASAVGDTLIFDSNTPGGYTLFEHSTNAVSIAKIESNDWDFVILQDQSQMPTIPFYRNNWTYPGARALDSLISANCSRPMFFMTWGRRDGGIQCIGGECSADFEDFEHMQDTLEAAYMRIAEELNVCCAPAGVAWKHAREIDSTWSFWSGDGSHPSPSGSYLTACVFYAMIFRSSPMGNPYHSSLSPGDAEFLQWVADSTVFDALAGWIDDSEVPDADFSFMIDSDTAQFNNASAGAMEFIWHFGDGATSFDIDPVHTYTSPGEYFVTLIASDGCMRDYAVDTITIESVGIEEWTVNKPQTFEISTYPNPFNSAVTIAIDTPVADGSPVPVSVEIYDVNGRRVEAVTEPDFMTPRVEVPVGGEATVGRLAKDTSTLRQAQGTANSVSVFAPLTKGGQGGYYIWTPDESLPSGVYLIRVEQDSRTYTKPVVYVK